MRVFVILWHYKEIIMRKIKVLLALFIISASLSGQAISYGENIEEGSIIENSQIQNLFVTKEKFNVKLEAKVTDVCQMKGCWMKLDIGNEKEIMVNFKDYSFFVSKNISVFENLLEQKYLEKSTGKIKVKYVGIFSKNFKKTIQVDLNKLKGFIDNH